MRLTILDTDILSEILKQKNSIVLQNAAAYFGSFGQFALSALTRYEARRGLLSKNATAQIRKFDRFCGKSLILPISDAVLDRAAELWCLAGVKGVPRSDADLIIAATALDCDRSLVTGNTAHFQWIPGLTIIDWRQPQTDPH